METNSYKGWLNSDSFVKRAFAVMGYNFVAGLMLWLGLLFVFLVLGVLAGVLI